jgi:myo-inositol 2-dehydrogenase/D-chiro-inositol 1-dehydrogenase
VDALLIAAPDPAHAELARACVRAGKPVLCEKPLATSAGDAQRVVADEVALGRRLVALGFMRRFDPPHVAVFEALQSGTLGRPVLLKGLSREITIPDDLPIATILTNSVIHDLDSARWMLGQEAAEVFVRGVRSRASFGPDTLDMLMVHLQMTGDTMASIEASLAVEYGYEIAAEVVCERGTVATMQPELACWRSGRQRGLPVPADWLERFQTAYVAELQAWVAALRAGRTFEGASAWDGYMASVIADACIEAVQTGKPVPVARPARPPLYG